MSALPQTSLALPTILAPASLKSSSAMEEPMPALVSTITLCPASIMALTPAGVMPTRYSLSLTSFGTPISMLQSLVLVFSRCLGPINPVISGKFVGSKVGERLATNDQRLASFLIDLRLLQFVTVIHVHALPLGVEVDGRVAAFAMSVARGLHAAEGQVNFRAD